MLYALIVMVLASACAEPTPQPANLAEGEFIRSTSAISVGKRSVALVMEVCKHHPGGAVSCETREIKPLSGDPSNKVTVTFGDVQ